MCREVIDQIRVTARSIRRSVFAVKAVISSDSEVWLHKSLVYVQQKFPSAHCCPEGTKALHCCSDTSLKTVQNNSDTAGWRHVWEIHTSCALLSLSPALVPPLALNLICVYLTCLIPDSNNESASHILQYTACVQPSNTHEYMKLNYSPVILFVLD